jgi:peptidoglycan/xylan/chitin deacetylase (PgdA/CDA1 family)
MYKLRVIILFLLLLSCSTGKERHGAVAFTFDDDWVDDWYTYRALFHEYDIKATFFITRPEKLDSASIEKLRQLNADGHEIACHSLTHKNLLDFHDSLDMMVSKEVIPALQSLRSMGFEIRSFAYPFGASTANTDSILQKYFIYLRKATWNTRNTRIDEYDEIYVNNSTQHIFSSMGIDHNFNITPENLRSGFRRAGRNHEVLVLYAHRIGTGEEEYMVNAKYLESYFRMCHQYHLEAITVSGLESFFRR